MSESDDFDSWFYDAIRGIHPPPDGADYATLRSEAEDRWMEHRRTGRPLPTFSGPAKVDVPGDDVPLYAPDDVIVGRIDDEVEESKRAGRRV